MVVITWINVEIFYTGYKKRHVQITCWKSNYFAIVWNSIKPFYYFIDR